MTTTSTLCQGLQSCLEPAILGPRVLMNKMAPLKSNISESIQKYNIAPQDEENQENVLSFNELQNHHDNGDINGGWSFIQALDNPSTYTKQADDEEDKVYVHPMMKQCSSTLNTKSLEMCTESLGSETGSDISESSDEFFPFSSEKETFHGVVQRSKFAKKVLNRAGSFPPPLSSISGRDSVQMRPQRHDGRLVLKAVTITSCYSFFQAERSHGRLRLSLLIDDEQLDEFAELDEEKVESQSNERDYGDESEEEQCSTNLQPRLSRCKENESRSEGIQSWGPFWVPIS